MKIETLESRRLLSASLAAGVLTVTGTDGNDRIEVSLDSHNQILVKQQTAGKNSSGGANVTRFDASAVSSIVVNALGGNDRLEISKKIMLPATLNGGDGNDILIAGGGVTMLNGGAGNDLLITKNGTGHDIVDGGDNTAAGDSAIVRMGDVVTNVEHVRTVGANDNNDNDNNDDNGNDLNDVDVKNATNSGKDKNDANDNDKNDDNGVDVNDVEHPRGRGN